jgi:hypothetical protein
MTGRIVDARDTDVAGGRPTASAGSRMLDKPHCTRPGSSTPIARLGVDVSVWADQRAGDLEATSAYPEGDAVVRDAKWTIGLGA